MPWKFILSKIDLTPVLREAFWWMGLGLLLYGVGRYWDEAYIEILFPLRTEFGNTLSYFITEIGFMLVILGIGLLMLRDIIRHVDNHYRWVPAFFSVITAGIITAILKVWFAIPRPYLETAAPLLSLESFSFPSGHTATAFALLLPMYRVYPLWGVFWAFAAILIGLCRVYQGVHFPSDIAGGIFLGGVIGSFFSHPQIHVLVQKMWQDLEFRRQTFHFCTGFLCVFFHWIGWLRLREIALLLALGLIISLVSQYRNIPVVSHFLRLFDRDRDQEFPGRGAFYFLLAVFICFLIFPIKVAYAVILILAVGDSLNHLVADMFQKPKSSIRLITQKISTKLPWYKAKKCLYWSFPWNPNKSMMGVALGVGAGTFAAHFFVSWYWALPACILALIVETVPIRIGNFYIDDNVTVPLVAGGVIIFLQNAQGVPLLNFARALLV